MNNWLVLPLLLPLFTAVLLIFFKERIGIQRQISLASALVNIAVAGGLVYQVQQKGIQSLFMGGWLPPYGIAFTADMLAALLVLSTAVVSTACLVYSFGSIGEERERNYFYPFFQFLLAGVSGSFLTGDIFNLFVCFEVMLMSSYALIVLGGTKQQLRETLKYILINIVSSTLFVASVAYLYAATGTLNMAHLSVRIAEAGPGGVLSVISVLFLIVFSLKAGLFLFFWLPGSYGAPPAAIGALFGALLTKVGLYAIIRTFTLLFYQETATGHSLMAWMGAATMILGAAGAVAFRDVARIMNYNVIISIGFTAFGIAAATSASLNGVVLYLLHDMVAKALMFMLGGMLVQAAGTGRITEMGGLMKKKPLLGWMFFILSLALAGVPPLSGFAGKMLIIRGGLESGLYLFTAVSLASSLIVLYSMLRIFMHAFWGEEKTSAPAMPRKQTGMTLAAGGLFCLMIVMGLGSEWLYSLVSQAGDILIQPELYIEAVLRR
ncbi:Na+/H+ antiporter subunit D [Paenibacillus sp. YN15]|uniref:Na+/H+ antiporter subunit D n=1 Tax=Paenibacillus sp. YN15 TaxID=1742774 RepID=UPI000DCDFC67|nr:Na+/H+ antiporter subunit D [Paenibacillus sp. YN15]RAV01278.1 Na+/H+ antiporter subunit D [Paenibacillus sp. YN15]